MWESVNSGDSVHQDAAMGARCFDTHQMPLVCAAPKGDPKSPNESGFKGKESPQTCAPSWSHAREGECQSPKDPVRLSPNESLKVWRVMIDEGRAQGQTGSQLLKLAA